MHHGEIESEIISLIEKSLRLVLEELGKTRAASPQLTAELEIPKEKFHGDLSTNIAMKASKFAQKAPLEIASLVKASLAKELPSSGLKDVFDRVEVKPPGFINFFFNSQYLHNTILDIQRKKNNFGRSNIGKGIKVQVEFVSANPTGPLTIAHGRQAAIGDSIVSILEFLGYGVRREYYLNDEGTQMDMLGNSVRIRYLELLGIREEFPADGYKGTYISQIAEDFKKRFGKKFIGTKDIEVFREFGMRWILNDIKKDLKDFGVHFDVWYSQKALRRSGKIEKAIGLLRKKGYIYEREGAVWFNSQAFGDDKDRVVFKSDGSATYLAPDIAYHIEKYRRGFKKIIDIWGPDHHGYVPRMKAAIKALGFSEDSLAILIVQLATLYKSGQVVAMSTRAGEFVTLREVIDDLGKDVARFCFIMRRISSHLDFDLDAVKKESIENPVYYIQYAHARICSIREYSKKSHSYGKPDLGLLKEEEEITLLRILRQFGLVVTLSGKALEPYILLQYLQDLATIFHCFYNRHRVVSDDPALTRARLVLVDSVRIVLANGLGLLGVSLPEKM